LVGLGLALAFALGVKGFGGVFSIRARTASRELSGAFVMADNRQELLVAVGEALAAWSAIEVFITDLFAILTDIPNKRDQTLNRRAHLIFDAIISLETRLDVVDVLMANEGLSPLEIETWNRAYLRTKDLYKKRHGLAHFGLVGNPTELDNPDPEKSGYISYSLSPFFSIGAAVSGGMKILTKAQIDERAVHFREMGAALYFFSLSKSASRAAARQSHARAAACRSLPGVSIPDSRRTWAHVSRAALLMMKGGTPGSCSRHRAVLARGSNEKLRR
jgi:hypothetical protein